MKILIVEDEKLLADELSEMLSILNPDIEVLGKLQSVSETVSWLQENSCDLIFLDIHLSDGLSFSIFNQVPINCPVIFTTAYDEYAIQAFDVNSIAYLLKPIEKEHLQKALDKYDRLTESNADDIHRLLTLMESKENAQKRYKNRIMLNIGKIQKPVKVEDIAYFRADDRYLFATTKNGEEYFYDSTLTKLTKVLDPKFFFRVNRSFFINYKSVVELNSYSKGRVVVKLTPKSNDLIVVSAKKTKEFKEWLGK